MKQVLGAIAAARQDEVSIECLGAGRVRHRRLRDELDDAKKLLDWGSDRNPEESRYSRGWR